MPTVPLSRQEVQQQAYDIPVPKFATPVKEAYTGMADANVDATAKLSQIAGGVADKVLQNNLWQEQARMYDSREKLAGDVTDMLTNSSTQKITDADGKEHEIPVGLLSRQNFAAQGSVKEYDEKIPALRDKYLDSFKMPQMKAQAARMFDGIVTTGRRQVANHEETQVREGVSNSFLSSAVQSTRDAAQALTPDDLMTNMEYTHKAYMNYGASKNMSPVQIEAGLEPMYGKSAETSAMAVLRKTGNLDQAMMQLDAVKTLIPNDYEKISEGLVRHNDIMTREVQRQGALDKINNQFGMISDFATPGATPPTTLDVENMVKSGKVDVEFASDYNSAMKAFDEQKSAPKVDKKGKLIPDSGEVPYSLGIKDSEENTAFASTMKNIMSSSSKEEVTNVLQQTMKLAGSGKFSEDKMKLTMFYALQRSNMLDDGMGIARTVNPELSKLDGGVQSLMDFQEKAGGMDHQTFSDFFDALGKNASPKDAADIAKTNRVLRIDPSVSTMDNIPTTIKPNRLTSAVSFKSGVKVRPHVFAKESSNGPTP